MAARSKPAGKAKSARPAVKSRVMLGGMPRALGVNLVSVSRKRVIAEMPVKPMHVNTGGRVNGGAIMAFGDICGAVGAVANMPPGHRGGTVESKTNFFAAGQAPVLKATSIPLHVGRTTSVWQTTIRNIDGRMVAIVTQTQISLPVKTAGAGDD
jgi:uncharacterized protein (TIGR00369 family)